MQLLFESSNEIKRTKGIGIIPGFVDSLKMGFNIGWKKIQINNSNYLNKSLKSKNTILFIHLNAYQKVRNI